MLIPAFSPNWSLGHNSILSDHQTVAILPDWGFPPETLKAHAHLLLNAPKLWTLLNSIVDSPSISHDLPHLRKIILDTLLQAGGKEYIPPDANGKIKDVQPAFFFMLNNLAPNFAFTPFEPDSPEVKLLNHAPKLWFALRWLYKSLFTADPQFAPILLDMQQLLLDAGGYIPDQNSEAESHD